MKEHKEADAAVLHSRPCPLQALGPASRCRLLLLFSTLKKKNYFLKIKEKYEIITKYLNFLTFIFKVDDYRCY